MSVMLHILINGSGNNINNNAHLNYGMDCIRVFCCSVAVSNVEENIN